MRSVLPTGQGARLFNQAQAIWSAPQVEIWLWGDTTCKEIYRTLTRPHPRFRVIQNKRWGAALMPVPDSIESYLEGGHKQFLRRKRRHALQAGLHYDLVDPMERLEEILAINRSMAVRQGRPVDADYCDRSILAEYLRDKPLLHGVYDAHGTLKAYAYAPVVGEIFLMARLLGHGDELKNGIMYLLISEIVGYMARRKAEEGHPRWAMYDMYWGAPPGLRYFKEKLGYSPYNVRWKWRHSSPCGSDSTPTS